MQSPLFPHTPVYVGAEDTAELRRTLRSSMCIPVCYTMIIGVATSVSLNVYLAISGRGYGSTCRRRVLRGYEEDLPGLLLIFHLYIVLVTALPLEIIMVVACPYNEGDGHGDADSYS